MLIHLQHPPLKKNLLIFNILFNAPRSHSAHRTQEDTGLTGIRDNS